MQKFCGKCGTKLDENGVCAVCNTAVDNQIDCATNNISEDSHPEQSVIATENIQDNNPQQKSEQEKAKLKKKIKRAKKKARKNANRTLKWKKMTKKQKITNITIKAVAALLCVMVVVTSSLFALTYFGVTDIPVINSALSKMGINSKNNTLTPQTVFTTIKVTDEESAKKAAQDAAKQLGLSNAANELEVVLFEKINDITYCRLQQTYKGIPVLNKSIVVTADKSGNAIGFSSNLTDIKLTNAEHKLTRDVAYEKIQQYVSDNKISDDSISILMQSYNELCYIMSADDKANLYYDLLVCFDSRLHRFVINANTGDVVLFDDITYHNETTAAATNLDGKDISINVEKSLFGYELTDTTRNIDVYSSNNQTSYPVFEFYVSDKLVYKFDAHTKVWSDTNGELFVDQHTGDVFDINGNDISEEFEDNYAAADVRLSFKTIESGAISTKPYNATETWHDSVSATVMYNTEKTYDYYLSLFNRKGYDNNNSRLYVVYSDNLNSQPTGAHSTSALSTSYLNLGYESGYCTDIIAHEYTHSVINNISHLKNSGESASINEAYCDIFAELVEAYTNNGKCDWNISGRNIEDPKSSSQPEVYKKSLWSGDSVDIHRNSTVISHTAYLMSTDSGSKYGLNHEQLGKLWYHTLYTLPFDADCSVLREQMLLTAHSLGFSSDQIECITSAFELVQIADKDQKSGFVAKSTMRITVNGPADVSVVCSDDEISSKDGLSGVSNSHCSITYNGSKNIIKNGCDTREKTIDLKSNGEHNIRLVGTGKGKLTYTIEFADEKGKFTDKRVFKEIDITEGAVIETLAEQSGTTTLSIDTDGDGSYDYKMDATENSYGKKVNHTLLYIILIILVSLLIGALVYLYLKKRNSSTSRRYPKTF